MLCLLTFESLGWFAMYRNEETFGRDGCQNVRHGEDDGMVATHASHKDACELALPDLGTLCTQYTQTGSCPKGASCNRVHGIFCKVNPYHS